ncbi:hypothetical protein [Anabaena azotica]|uniref:hypothetical protein n=1 Tax=Anabaena azotica TaxID=197653 RepID=UPI0039A635EB
MPSVRVSVSKDSLRGQYVAKDSDGNRGTGSSPENARDGLRAAQIKAADKKDKK